MMLRTSGAALVYRLYVMGSKCSHLSLENDISIGVVCTARAAQEINTIKPGLSG